MITYGRITDKDGAMICDHKDVDDFGLVRNILHYPFQVTLLTLSAISYLYNFPLGPSLVRTRVCDF